ncbi:MAG TPA: NifU family protein [Flavobacteriales bacterium]|nr:NifU family protein [Flavobacteriales bacterium]HOP42172.1 NifU family protein [Flavobacteriales bacterium]HPF67580.1 NifU family protein [Flavobacteriales bacterium]HPQ57500.1 NifU family protein [Flavobacteriales bacterium]HRW89293.1 NifU family protein [Flavobacteriales bacterium]
MLNARDIRTAGERIEQALTELRPFLEADGGDITLEEVTPEGVARVRLHGACRTCTMSAMTLKAGVEDAIRRVAPAVQRVEAIAPKEPA